MNNQWLQASEWQRGECRLICVERWQETHDVTSFRFQAEKPVKFNFKPGQFITFLLHIDDESVARSYTISSSPSRPFSITVTIKRIEGGKVSNYLIDHLAVGQSVKVLGPEGAFNLVDIEADKYLFLSAGSGITPMFSMSRWLLDTEMGSDIAFLHSAKSLDDLIFKHQLATMAQRHSGFELNYLIESKDLLQESNFANGRISLAKLQQFVPDFLTRTIFVCGPAPYMQAVNHLLQQAGFDMNRFHQESFGEPTTKQAIIDRNTDVATQSFMLTVGETNVALSSEQPLLEGIEQLKLPIIAACRSGVCGACKCKVTAGKVESTSQMTLTAEEIEQGYVLACSSKLISDVTLSLNG
ncbi:hybrid-cluster NAD(P)-dependent oxidoreductase [Shewanella sp. Isolate11]|uniref:hybrid-cluster NAD(P)-dependent oxidoreductase n=1 Tax=Shewanella sp. Isolate11 TaxID=2908530 RepID=UPI001EFC9978|nr:hybrid-cluster NAD(P)-dependent oxidoreductase [Shewanella sp. Isolate11]MCG9695961.1 hybrid-cluster NAD(P)-dependent oxidoreductase [Shewanella sp. Isolate11]